MIPEDNIIQESLVKVEAAVRNEKEDPTYNLEGIRSLSDYYNIDKLSASRFLNAAKNNKIGKLQEDDKYLCLESLDVKDPDFSKTLDLLFQAVRNQTPLAKQCIGYASQACKQQLREHYKIDIDIHKAANVIFDEVLQILKPELTNKKADARSLNLLKGLGIWKSYSRNLNDIELTEILMNELMKRNKTKSSGGISSVAEILLRPSTKIKAMTDMLQIAESSMSKAKLAIYSEGQERQQRENEHKRAQGLQAELIEANQKLQRKEAENLGLSANLERAENEKKTLEQQIKHEQAVSIHGKGELKGHSRVFLEKKLIPLLETALEFAELDPPRKNIIVERLEMASEEIKKEIEWLKSTD